MKQLLILTIIFTASLFAQDKYLFTDAKNHVDETVVINGEVTQVTITAKGMGYLNFGDKFPKNQFTAVVFAKDVEKFGDLKRFEGKTVEVSGKVELYKEKPQIILKKVDQIKIVE
ncbi:MAG: exodeoxyribonuclease VII large subunit [Ignavibacteriales bacterium]|nr:exodeoxyribonuclease VII large subunit [Ignavibacteriales bacterium]